MKKIYFLTVLILTTFILKSCECFPSSNGIVRDKDSKKLLDSVLVKIYSDKDLVETYYTDSSGKYHAFISSSRTCRQLNIEFTRIGYDTVKVSDPLTENNIVDLKKK